MLENQELLHIVSNETKDSVDQINVVTPSIYGSIFSEFAQKHRVEMDNELDLSRELLQLECNNLTQMQDTTVKNAISLSNSTSKAINAIKEKDENVLNSVLKETEALRIEIEKLKESVYKDELTNVHNRKWLHDTFLEEGNDKFKENGTLVIIDLNYFKIVNDTYGHVIGDKVLIYIANQLQKTKNSVIRYGGDEFLVIFSGKTSKEQALKSLNDIREVVIKKKLKTQKESFHVSFSFGAKEYKVGEHLSSTIEEADKNMYNDKIQIKKRITGIN